MEARVRWQSSEPNDGGGQSNEGCEAYSEPPQVAMRWDCFMRQKLQITHVVPGGLAQQATSGKAVSMKSTLWQTKNRENLTRQP